jgi:hypothetical protein
LLGKLIIMECGEIVNRIWPSLQVSLIWERLQKPE